MKYMFYTSMVIAFLFLVFSEEEFMDLFSVGSFSCIRRFPRIRRFLNRYNSVFNKLFLLFVGISIFLFEEMIYGM